MKGAVKYVKKVESNTKRVEEERILKEDAGKVCSSWSLCVLVLNEPVQQLLLLSMNLLLRNSKLPTAYKLVKYYTVSTPNNHRPLTPFHCQAYRFGLYYGHLSYTAEEMHQLVSRVNLALRHSSFMITRAVWQQDMEFWVPQKMFRWMMTAVVVDMVPVIAVTTYRE